jgi:hypothetical protein
VDECVSIGLLKVLFTVSVRLYKDEWTNSLKGEDPAEVYRGEANYVVNCKGNMKTGLAGAYDLQQCL